MNARSILTLSTAVVLGGALITGSAFGRAEERNMSDSWISAKTKIAMFADSRVKGSEINVSTSHGTVMIRGKVDTKAAKQAAESIAKDMAGVKKVKNELQVVAPANREATDDKDEAITSRVNEKMASEGKLKDAGIKVQVNAGVVSLIGEVPDLATSAHASSSAWRVPGVKSVKNDLTVKEKRK